MNLLEIPKAKTRMVRNFCHISPEMANRLMLLNSDINRKFRPTRVARMARAIKRGAWIPTHEGIAFDMHGRMIDGQHRLRAIMLAGIGIDIWVTEMLSEDSYKVIDDGLPRSIADHTLMSAKTSEVCRTLASMMYGNNRYDSDQCNTIGKSGVEPVADRLVAFCQTNARLFSSAPVRTAAVLLVLNGAAEGLVFQTYKDLVLGNFASLPPSVSSYVKHAISQNMFLPKEESYARALKALNPDNHNALRVQYTKSWQKDADDFAKAVLCKLLKVQA